MIDCRKPADLYDTNVYSELTETEVQRQSIFIRSDSGQPADIYLPNSGRVQSTPKSTFRLYATGALSRLGWNMSTGNC
jgi:hypothetical protein